MSSLVYLTSYILTRPREFIIYYYYGGGRRYAGIVYCRGAGRSAGGVLVVVKNRTKGG